MTLTIFDQFWHRTLGRPYGLAKALDVGAGPPVVLLHGIGRTGQTWQHVMELLAPLPRRILAFDLLGFGGSPKPKWLQYNVDDHARAVIRSIGKEKLGQPVVLVGHSMGCLVAVRVALLRPDLVKHLVLYEMPLYDGLPEKRIYRLRTNLYLKLYKRLIRSDLKFDQAKLHLTERLTKRIVGFEVTNESWLPFIRSLENTIVKQSTAKDIKQLDIAMDVIYGRFDMLVIRGEPQAFFGSEHDHITAHTIRARHVITPKASAFIVERVEAALQS